MDDQTLYVSDRPHSYGCEVAVGSPAGQVVMIALTRWVPHCDATRLTARVVHAANAHADLLAACVQMLEALGNSRIRRTPTEADAAVATMRAAVAKATDVEATPDE